MQAMEAMRDRMLAFLEEEIRGAGFDGAVFGLSGGLDSAVVAKLLSLTSLRVKALLMPSSRSSQRHLEDAMAWAGELGIEYELRPLCEYERGLDGMDARRYGNACARLRMLLLYDASLRDGALVVGTSNKSELILGYGTLHGDLACAINPIGSVLKSDLFAFAQFLHLPPHLITKAPSADLYEGQSDEGEIGYPYTLIDSFIRSVLSLGLEWRDREGILEAMGGAYEREFLERILDRICANAFKSQAPKILEL